MTTYSQGRRIEYLARDYLKQLGADLIVRSAGSKGLVDLVAFFVGSRTIMLVQVKKIRENANVKTLLKRYRSLDYLKGEYSVISRLFVKDKEGIKLIEIGEDEKAFK